MLNNHVAEGEKVFQDEKNLFGVFFCFLSDEKFDNPREKKCRALFKKVQMLKYERNRIGLDNFQPNNNTSKLRLL